MQKLKLEKLASPGFILALLLLLANDFIFKNTFHNFITGKLSDFAGLFVFPLFWLAIFPQRKNPIYLLTALLFIFWKSPYSQVFIDTWNSLALLKITRVVDYTDLLALLILPISYYYDHLPIPIQVTRWTHCLIVCVSLFAFIATSGENSGSVHKTYEFDFSEEELLKKIDSVLKGCQGAEKHSSNLNGKDFSNYDITFCSRLCRPYLDRTIPITVTISINNFQGENKSSISLQYIYAHIIEADYECRNYSPKRKDKPLDALEQKQFLLHIFEKEFIDRLKYGKFED